MPMIRSLYPKNWNEIARCTKRRANWHCQACAKPCLLPKEDWLHFVIRQNWTVGEAIACSTHPNRYQLGVAHPNHDPENPEAELSAWCAPCHCRYDLKAMAYKKRLKRERNGQLSLDILVAPEPAGHGKDPNAVQLPLRGRLDAT